MDGHRVPADDDQLLADRVRNDRGIAAAAEKLIKALEYVCDHGDECIPEELEALYNEEPEEPIPLFLKHFADTFSLGNFETRVLLLCLVANVDSDFMGMAAEAQSLDEIQRLGITVSLALTLFPDGQHDHFLPGGALLQNGLITLSGLPLYQAEINLDRAVANYLITGIYADTFLEGLIRDLHAVTALTSSQLVVAGLAAEGIRRRGSSVQLFGTDDVALRSVAADVGRLLGCSTEQVSYLRLTDHANTLHELANRWVRRALLNDSLLVVDATGIPPKDRDFEVSLQFYRHFLELIGVPTLILSTGRLDLRQESILVFEVDRPTPDELAPVWRSVLYKARCLTVASLTEEEGTLHISDMHDIRFGRELAACFAFSIADVDAVADAFHARIKAIRNDVCEITLTAELTDGILPEVWRDCWWQCARLLARPSFDGLARRIEATATFSSLVVEPQTETIIQEIANQFNARALVRGDWRLEPALQRGNGITVLFAGGSGTGKTLGAEVLANMLSLDLYQIDLSQLVSKYIGETQKNLARVFETAEKGGSVLLFDEADALFSRRTDVKDSKDRHANMEVGYLLQRMEAYTGIAILTSNLKDSIDDAFLRRLQFVVDFPFPDVDQRMRLWQSMLPDTVPMGEIPSAAALANLALNGAQIKNVVRRAVYLAASRCGRLESDDLIYAAHAEMEKSDRALSLDDMREILR